MFNLSGNNIPLIKEYEIDEDTVIAYGEAVGIADGKVTLDNVWDHFQIIRLQGLDPQKIYHCPQLDLTASGALLMNAGINMTEIAPWAYGSAKLHFIAK